MHFLVQKLKFQPKVHMYVAMGWWHQYQIKQRFTLEFKQE